MGGVSEEEVLGPDGEVDPVAVERVIDGLAERADRAAETSTPSEKAGAERVLRDGLGQAIGLYVLLRTGDRHYRFSEQEFERLESVMRTFLERYAQSYGTDIESSATLSSAAETLLETNDLRQTAAMLTGVSERDG